MTLVGRLVPTSPSLAPAEGCPLVANTARTIQGLFSVGSSPCSLGVLVKSLNLSGSLFYILEHERMKRKPLNVMGVSKSSLQVTAEVNIREST